MITGWTGFVQVRGDFVVALERIREGFKSLQVRGQIVTPNRGQTVTKSVSLDSARQFETLLV